MHLLANIKLVLFVTLLDVRNIKQKKNYSLLSGVDGKILREITENLSRGLSVKPPETAEQTTMLAATARLVAQQQLYSWCAKVNALLGNRLVYEAITMQRHGGKQQSINQRAYMHNTGVICKLILSVGFILR